MTPSSPNDEVLPERRLLGRQVAGAQERPSADRLLSEWHIPGCRSESRVPQHRLLLTPSKQRSTSQTAAARMGFGYPRGMPISLKRHGGLHHVATVRAGRHDRVSASAGGAGRRSQRKT